MFDIKGYAKSKPVWQQVELNGVEGIVKKHDKKGDEHSGDNVQFIGQQAEIKGCRGNPFVFIESNVVMNPFGNFIIDVVEPGDSFRIRCGRFGHYRI